MVGAQKVLAGGRFREGEDAEASDEARSKVLLPRRRCAEWPDRGRAENLDERGGRGVVDCPNDH